MGHIKKILIAFWWVIDALLSVLIQLLVDGFEAMMGYISSILMALIIRPVYKIIERFLK